ncbi:MAG: hypothetical protein Kow00127_17490 [Bacteroidales bacterium]
MAVPFIERIRLVQSFLKRNGLYDGKIDGIAGPLTNAGIDWLGIESRWPVKRKIIAAIQHFANQYGVDVGTVDGR